MEVSSRDASAGSSHNEQPALAGRETTMELIEKSEKINTLVREQVGKSDDLKKPVNNCGLTPCAKISCEFKTTHSLIATIH